MIFFIKKKKKFLWRNQIFILSIIVIFPSEKFAISGWGLYFVESITLLHE